MNSLYLFVFTKIASTTGFIVLALLITLVLLVQKQWWTARVFCFATLIFMGTVETLKNTFQIERPGYALIELSSYAFPSGHAAGSAFLAGVLCYFARKLPRSMRFLVYVTLMSVVLIIGLSRLQLGVHTLFQVVVGYVLGIICALVTIVFIKGKRQQTSQSP